MKTQPQAPFFGVVAGALAAAALLSSVVTGCGNTLGGAKQDMSQDTQSVKSAAQKGVSVVANAGTEAKTAVQNVGATAKQTVDNAGAAAAGAVDKVGAAAKETAANAAAATVLTPKIKLALIRDPLTDNTKNHINVSSTAQVVRLQGTVINATDKQHATDDAQDVLDNNHSSAKLINELQVAGT